MAEYHLRASHWYEANGYLAEAFQHAVAAKDFDRAADVAEQAWPSMEGTFQTAAWLGWIKQLPEDVIRVRPVLCTQIGWAFSDAGEPETSERHLQNAERALAGAADRAEFRQPLPGSIALARAYNAQVQGHVADTVKYAELAQQLIPEDDVYRRAQAVIMLEFTHWANGDLEAARRALDDWMNTMRQIGNVVFVIATAFGVADIQVAQGRLREALRTYESLCSWPPRPARKRRRSRRIIIWGWRCCITNWVTRKISRNIGRRPKNWASRRRWSTGRIAGMWHRRA